jgi:hypothetical protein
MRAEEVKLRTLRQHLHRARIGAARNGGGGHALGQRDHLRRAATRGIGQALHRRQHRPWHATALRRQRTRHVRPGIADLEQEGRTAKPPRHQRR